MEKIIVANQKMYLENLNDVLSFKKDLYPYKDKFIIMPSYIYLNEFKDFNLGLQNISHLETGPSTGEVSIKQAYDYKVKYILIGHSETDRKHINEKIKLALKYGITPIVCVGEDKNQDVFETIKRQIEKLDINENVIISYEPLWAVGTGNIPTLNDLTPIISYIKKLKNVKVLYGGSITDKNIKDLCNLPNLDGYLIGKASTDSKQFIKIIEVVCSI